MLKSNEKKLTKLGGAYAMLLPKSWLDLLDVNPSNELSIILDTENESITIKKTKKENN